MQPIAPATDPQTSQEPIASGAHQARHRVRFEYGNGDKPLHGYVIKRGLGVGGFGEVYHAQSESGKNVALKRILRNVDVEMRGVQQCLNVRHPNLIALYDLRQDSFDQSWVIMELVEGESLRARIDRFPNGLPQCEAESLFAQLVAGVAYLHEQGLVHRDLKPANIFIENGLVKIGDYGLSKYISTSRRGGQTESVGTFHYMAPEIGRGDYGREIDIYALGVIYYEMLTGEVPFDGESSQEIIVKHLSATPDLSLLSQGNRIVVGRSLAKDPAKRFQDGKELLSAFGWEIGPTGLAIQSIPSEPSKLPSKWGGIPVPRKFARNKRDDLPTAKLITAKETGPLQTAAPIPPLKPEPSIDFESIHFNPPPSPTQPPKPNDSLYDEPIARLLHETIGRMINVVNCQPEGTKNLITVAMVAFGLLFAISGGLPMVMFGLCLYACYYPFYYFLIRPWHQDQLHPLAQLQGQQPAIHPPAPPAGFPIAPPSLSQDIGNRLSGVSSIGFAWAILLIAYWFGWHEMKNSSPSIEDSAQLLWFGAMVLLAAWTVIVISPTRLPIASRFRQRLIQGVAGLGLGAVSSVVTCYLDTPFEFTTPQEIWQALFGSRQSEGIWLSNIGFFGTWMFCMRWWKLTTISRRRKFKASPVVLSSLIGAGLSVLMGYDAVLGMIYPALVTSLVQIGAPRTQSEPVDAPAQEKRYAC